MTCCAIIPVYNHGQVITKTLSDVLAFNLPVILVNDGSDESCSKVLAALAQQAQVTLVSLPENRGKGGAVKAGLKKAKELNFSHALQVDADGQHNLADIPVFLSSAEKFADAIICGVPEYDESIPSARRYGRYLTHVWVWINTLSFAIVDSMCGFRVYPVAQVCDLLDSTFTGDRMDFDPEVLVRWFWRGGHIVNIKTRVLYPEQGVSHFQPARDNWLISCMHTRLFFGMLVRAPLWLVGMQARGKCL